MFCFMLTNCWQHTACSQDKHNTPTSRNPPPLIIVFKEARHWTTFCAGESVLELPSPVSYVHKLPDLPDSYVPKGPAQNSFAQIGTGYTHDKLCRYTECSPDKTQTQRIGTRTAAAWPSRRLRHRPAVLFRLLHINVRLKNVSLRVSVLRLT